MTCAGRVNCVHPRRTAGCLSRGKTRSGTSHSDSAAAVRIVPGQTIFIPRRELAHTAWRRRRAGRVLWSARACRFITVERRERETTITGAKLGWRAAGTSESPASCRSARIRPSTSTESPLSPLVRNKWRAVNRFRSIASRSVNWFWCCLFPTPPQ